MTTDLIIIGAGPGGYETAVQAAKAGLKVTVVEAKAVGGTCLYEGCIPTKCLCHTAETLEQVRNAAQYGIETDGHISFDLSKAVARKNEVTSKLAEGILTLMQTPGITFIQGLARFADTHTVRIRKEDGSEEEVTADRIIIATGSVTKYLPVEGAQCKGVVTSTEMLSLTTLPHRLCIIGGGVIGMEFASIFNAFGTEITVVEYCKEILPNFDRDIAKRLRTALKKKGITFKTGAAVTGIVPQADGYEVTFEEKGQTGHIVTDLVLMAVGRKANIDSLNLEEAGIEFSAHGIKVDENMQTNIPGIYAVGDINGLCQLAHAATFQGYRALNHILGRKDSIRFDIVPAAVFTVPEVASVGTTEEALAEQGAAYTVHKAFYRTNGKALSMDAGEGLIKLLASPNGEILGAHILGHGADTLIHEVAVLMNRKGTLEELQNAIHAHPTLSELIRAAAEA